jgi:hypothetical protein
LVEVFCCFGQTLIPRLQIAQILIGHRQPEWFDPIATS